MKIAIITSVSLTSSKDLAAHLQLNGIKADVFQPFKDDSRDFRNYDYVFSYGCSATTYHRNRLNSRQAILTCVDKFLTFDAFERAGVLHPRHWKNAHDVPKDCMSLVLRKDPCGRKAEDLSYWDRGNGPIPLGMGLYSEWFAHERELRVTVFKDQCFVYRKDYVKGDHIFNLSTSRVYDLIREDAFAAAEAIGIDYVSFDVLYNSKHDYCFLEANSGSLLTDEASMAIVEYFLNLE